MDDELEDFEDDEETVLPAPKRGNKWMVIGAFFELLANITRAFSAFFDALTDESLAKYRFERNQQEFMIQASREIEMLTSGDYNAPTSKTGPSFGPWPDEPAD